MSISRERLDDLTGVPTAHELEALLRGAPREVVPPAGPDPERIADEAFNEAAWLCARLLVAVLTGAALVGLLSRIV